MGKKLSKAPVYYTVTQVQFNHRLDLDAFLPDLQPRMTEIGFPDFQPQIYQNLILPLATGDGGQAPPPSIGSRLRYVFGDMRARTHFVLETNSLTLQSTSYETFEIFLETFMRGLALIQNALHLAFFDRIGLRYLDGVFPLVPGDDLTAFLVPEVQGLSGKAQGALDHSITETVSRTSNGQVISRVLIRDGRLGFPVDFAISPPQLDPRFSHFEGRHAILDTDAFSVSREPFDLDAIRTKLISLHAIVRDSFYATVTPHALATWA
jgi:uncharacterized protein (TIGR04255 family)